ncbi:Family 2 glycosyl transferase [Operophtera brumata]|uniref:Family 2 glycosyl transferase n=1 Tax=Operophtera brumata TaxID=104452 RepID=A0A0L7LV12_OPEBR|nr:Family 2 glycosyl transferase [Operophtera brumata]
MQHLPEAIQHVPEAIQHVPEAMLHVVAFQHVPEAMQHVPEAVEEVLRAKEPQKSVTTMLQEAGLADIQIPREQVAPAVTSRDKTSKRHDSDSSETPLGSLDRTKVSLGDSAQTTDSKRFIRIKTTWFYSHQKMSSYFGDIRCRLGLQVSGVFRIKWLQV